MKAAAKKQATREALFQAAMNLFAERGYEATTVREIVERAGVAKGTFFNYFPTKESILVEVGTVQARWAAEELHRLAQGPGPYGPPLLDLMVEMATRLGFTPQLVAALFRGALADSERLAGELAHAQALTAGLSDLFDRGQNTGEFSQELPPMLLAQLATEAYFGALWAWVGSGGVYDLAQAMRLSFHTFLYGVATRRPEGA